MFKFLKNRDYAGVIRFTIYLLLGVIMTLVFLFIFALVITFFDLQGFYNGIFATVSIILGTFVSAYFYVSKIKSKGFLNGVLIGASIFIIIFIASLFLSDKGFSLSSLFHLISALLSGGIGGIIQVNKKQNLKYLK